MSAPVIGEDPVRDQLVRFVQGLRRQHVTDDDLKMVRHAVLDVLSATLAGAETAPVSAARRVCQPMPLGGGASVLGLQMPATPDQAALVNGTAARVAEMNDVYVSRIGLGTHPSDMTLPILAVAESVRASGLETSLALLAAYEVYIELADSIDITGFDAATFAGMGVALASARLLGLDFDQSATALGIVTITHNPLVQTRRGRLTMWKAAAAGHAGSCGVRAAMLAKAGMEAPAQPFVGQDGWGQLVARSDLSALSLDRRPARFRIHDVTVKPRAACQNTISSILAAEAASAQGPAVANIVGVRVETYAAAKELTGTGAERWDPTTPETADHSIPYVVAAALIDGRVGPRSFTEARLWDPALRRMLSCVDVVANDSFTAANERWPQEHPTKVVVTLASGDKVVGRTGGDHGDLTDPPTWQDLVVKFEEMAATRMRADTARSVVSLVDELEQLPDVSPLVSGCLRPE